MKHITVNNYIKYVFHSICVIGFLFSLSQFAYGQSEPLSKDKSYWLEKYKHKNSIVRAEAISKLGEMKDTGLLDFFITCLGDESQEVRDSAVIAVSKIGQYAVPRLISAIENGTKNECRYAIKVLGLIKAKDTIQLLMNIYPTQDESTKYEIIKTLGEIGDKSGLALLSSSIKDKSKILREITVVSLLNIEIIPRKYDDSIIPVLIQFIENDVDALIRNAPIRIIRITGVSTMIDYIKYYRAYSLHPASVVLSKLGNRVTPYLSEYFNEQNDENITPNLLLTVGSIRDVSLVDVLIKFLESKHDPQRACAIMALSNLLDNDTSKAVVNIAISGNCKLQESIILALGLSGHKEYVAEIEKFIKADDSDVQKAIVFSLGQIKSEESAFLLIKLLHNKEFQYMKYEIVKNLGNMHISSVAPMLIDIFDNETDSLLNDYIKEALIKIKNKKILSNMKNFLDGKNIFMRGYAAEVLGSITKDRAIETVLINMLDKKENINIRKSLIRALGEMHSKRCIPKLLNFILPGNDQEMRIAAIKALGQIKNKNTVLPLIESIKNEKNREIIINIIETLGIIKDRKASTLLLSFLLNDDTFVREAARKALISMGDKTIIPSIIGYLNNKNQGIKIDAAIILENFTGYHFAFDVTKWQGWWEANEDRILKEEAEKEKVEKEKESKEKKDDESPLV